MHIVAVGQGSRTRGGVGGWCRFRCPRCEHATKRVPVWQRIDFVKKPSGKMTITEARRGIPCPHCSGVTDAP